MKRIAYSLIACVILAGVIWWGYHRGDSNHEKHEIHEKEFEHEVAEENKSNIEHSTSNVQHPISNALHSQQPTVPAPSSSLYALSSSLPIDRDPDMGTPRFVGKRSGFLSEPAPDKSPAEIATVFVDANQKTFTLHPTDIQGTNAVITRDVVTKHNGMRSLTWQQVFSGVDIFGATFVMNLTKDGRIINVQSTALHMPCVRFHDEVNVTAEEAEQRGRTTNGHEWTRMGKEAKEIWYPLDQVSVVKCWDLMVEGRRKEGEKLTTKDRRERKEEAERDFNVQRPTSNIEHPNSHNSKSAVNSPHSIVHRLLIRADTGEVVEDICLTWGLEAATFNVYTNDSPEPCTPGPNAPTNYVPPEVSRTIVSLSALDTNASPAGWVTDGQYALVGNNADVYADWDDNDSRDDPPVAGTTNRVFDLPCDLTGHPTNYVEFSQVQAFYMANMFHDRMYQLGFDEVAGNFQSDNFGRGGYQGDALVIEVQNGADLGFEYGNQAWYQGWGDGSQGKLSVSVFGRSSPHRCGAQDAQLIYHEMTHGLSSRLIGDGFGLTTVPTRGMAEGWSDFFALTLPAESTDDIHGCYPFATYAPIYHDDEGTHYFGIRRFPYSTQTNKAPQTLADIDPNQQSFPPGVPRNPDFGSEEADQMHNIGEVWCLMLWECRANLIEEYDFVGNEMMMQLVVDGMKLSPVNPTFIEGRDAILQADMVNDGGTNQIALWKGFAKRGLGYDAWVPGSVSTVGIIESYELPFGVGVTVTEVGGDGDGYVEPGEDGEMMVRLTSHEMELGDAEGELNHGWTQMDTDILITSSNTLFGDVEVGGVSTSVPPFEFSVSTNFTGNSNAWFVLRVDSDKGWFEESFGVLIGNPYDYPPEILDVAVTNIGETNAWVSWRTGIESTGTVQWGEGGTTNEHEWTLTGTNHSVELCGLDLGTDYYYRIVAVGTNGLTNTTADMMFRTRARIYVSVDSAVTQELGTIDAPFKTLQAAAEAAKLNEDTILVATGTYTSSQIEAILECANADYDLTIEGGYNLDFSARNHELHVTTLDGQRLRRGIWMDNGARVDISGVTITRGQSEWGGGVHVRKSEFSATDCVISDNSSTNGVNNDGGGVYSTLGSDIRIQSCAIFHNKSDYGGGVIGISSDTQVAIFDTLICSNHASLTSGGVELLIGAYAQIRGCLIFENEGTHIGGGVSVLPYCEAIIENSTITKNVNTSANNSHSDGGGGVIVAGSSSTGILTINNCIIYGNISNYGNDMRCASQSEVHANYCNIGDIYGTLDTSNHVISVDPLFAYPEAGDFHLLYGSPCIDTGMTNYGGCMVDMDGEARPFGTAVDIGADEFVDVDGDNMADYWEISHFGDTGTTEGTEDTDGDDLDTFGEYMNQTDPHDGDTDSDVMPDGWEVTNSLNAKVDDAGLDADGDSFVNLSEYSADTDPQDVSSLLRVNYVGDEWGGRRVEWQGGVNAWQTIERSATLGDDAEWKLLWHREPPTPVSNAVIIFQSAERQFYRVRAGR